MFDLDNVIKLINAISIYYANIDEYINAKNPELYDNVNKLLDKIKMIEIKLKDIKKNIKPFKFSHTIEYLNYLLNKLYKYLDIPIQSDSYISSSKAAEANKSFAIVGAVYKKYITDFMREWDQFQNILVRMVIESKIDKIEAQTEFRQYPYSVKVYAKFMEIVLDKSSDEEQKEIYKMLEMDKTILLNENRWISKFLTFNLVPATRVVGFSELIDDLKKNKSEQQLYIIEKNTNFINVLPTSSANMEKGPTTKDVMRTLIPVLTKSTKIWNLPREKISDMSNTIFIEKFGDQARVLETTDPNMMDKIKNKRFGRPEAYNNQFEKKLKKHISRHTKSVSTQVFPKKHLALDASSIHSKLMRFYTDNKTPTATFVRSGKLADKFSMLVLQKLNIPKNATSTYIYIITWLRNYVHNKLVQSYDGEVKENPTRTRLDNIKWFRKVSKRIINTWIKNKRDNVFQMIYQHSYQSDAVFRTNYK